MQPVIPASTSQANKVHTPATGVAAAFTSQTRMQTSSAQSTPINHSGPQAGHDPRNTSKNKAGTRNRFVKLRLSPDEYADVATRADAAGVTLCEHIRQQLLAVHHSLDVRHELNALRGQLASGVPTAAEVLAQEAVLILRELAAGRDAHILSRVRAQMAVGGAR
jgi:hypothetical protein